jgi:hypothetical protein
MLEDGSKTKAITYSLKEQRTRGHCSDPSVLNVVSTDFHLLNKYKQSTVTDHNVMCQHFTALAASGRKLGASSVRFLSDFKHNDVYMATGRTFCNEQSHMKLTFRNAYIYWIYTVFWPVESLKKQRVNSISLKLRHDLHKWCSSMDICANRSRRRE